MSRLFLIYLLSFLACPAFATYKCASDGQTYYSDRPCQDGKQAIITPTGVNTTDSAEARQRAEREKKELKQLENARHKREAREEKEQKKAEKEALSHKKKCASLAQKRKWAEEDAASAPIKSAEKAKLKARRSAEKYTLECGK